jgi:hypothetical protein
VRLPGVRTFLFASLVAIVASRALGALRLPPSFLDSRAGTYLWPFVVDGLFQCGIVAFAISAVLLLLRRISPRLGAAATRGLRSFAIGAAVMVPVAFLTGEIFLRVVYPQGASFSEHIGPIVRRFERDFRTNSFEGPSRGPDDRGPKPPGTIRVLIQGDSITWGQGIRDEAELYTSRLLAELRRRRLGAEMAVLAQCGREIDGHDANLRRYGDEVDPDLIVYQWHPTDMLRPVWQRRPNADPPWTSLFFHPLLKQTSWVWFFVDFKAKAIVNPDLSREYREFIVREFGSDTPVWRIFAEEFRAWAEEARRRTPRVLVMLYPDVGSAGFVLGPVHEQMRALGRETGVEVLDLAEGGGLLGGDKKRVSVSRYDGHPNAVVHGLMAERLLAAIERAWPELLAADSPAAAAPPPSAPADRG